ncbi:hypothetical protein DPMN_015344 [Dreissena polymorpha]|uniref:Uncharacterized protein n=1 Tax=Dreissena polymorpha TaxID=45954 RepID=A0A9D4NBE2_DREPO|nr:hypothetical protein DPMN_015298 [Dreissena polymorpha]KAH3891251.1 hypothetical protein DPMN_015344 [Dreissena polymorpha]
MLYIAVHELVSTCLSDADDTTSCLDGSIYVTSDCKFRSQCLFIGSGIGAWFGDYT